MNMRLFRDILDAGGYALHWLRPLSRVMLVLTPVSSIKTSRSGFSQLCQPRQP